MKKDMRLKENWTEERMINALYKKDVCHYCGVKKGKLHFQCWHGFNEMIGLIEIGWKNE